MGFRSLDSYCSYNFRGVMRVVVRSYSILRKLPFSFENVPMGVVRRLFPREVSEQ